MQCVQWKQREICFCYVLALFVESNYETDNVLSLQNLPETSYSSSGSLNDTTQPHFSRFHDPDVIGWFPSEDTSSSKDQWIQVDFGHPKLITEIFIAGSQKAHLSVYKMYAGIDGHTFTELTDADQVISGADSERQIKLRKLLFCRYFKLTPVSSVVYPALRWEFVEASGKLTHLYSV